MTDICNFASAGFAFVAAILWVISASIKTPQSFSVNVTTVHRGDPECPSAEVVGGGFGTSDDLNALGKALILQSRFSAMAAGSAAIAAVCQGLALLAQQNSN